LIEEKPEDMAKALQLKLDGEAHETPGVHVYYCGPSHGIPEVSDSLEMAIIDTLLLQHSLILTTVSSKNLPYLRPFKKQC
jgi:hypothetical protein